MKKSKDKPKDPFNPDWKSIGIGIVVGVILISLIGLAGGRVKEWSFLGIKIGFPEQTPIVQTSNLSNGSVNLLSVSYEYEGWNPKIIDLRTAHKDGIPVDFDGSLKLFDLFVYVPENITNYVVVAVVYGNDELIGQTESQRLSPGINKINDVEIKNYHHDKVDNAWRIQDDWKSISIVLMYYIAENKIGSTSNTILLNSSGTSWYHAPPYIHIKEISYAIDDGPVQIMDLSKAIEVDAEREHKIRIENIWYSSYSAAQNRSFRIYAYIDNLDNSSANQRNSEIKQGVNSIINLVPFELTIHPDSETLVVDLSRDDGILLEQLIIPISHQ